MLKRINAYFTTVEKLLWLSSVLLVTLPFFIFGGSGLLSLAASLVGVTALIFNAKGNPLGQALSIAFAVLYGIISYRAAYYGEMMTYLGMTGPMAVFSLISWLRNPFADQHSEVRVNRITPLETAFMLLLTAAVTAIFYFILRAFGTAFLSVSTLSITTSFAAVYLTFRRSKMFAIAYALNDIVLIILWIAASIKDRSDVTVIFCFVAFLANDIYSFINWRNIERRQHKLVQNRQNTPS